MYSQSRSEQQKTRKIDRSTDIGTHTTNTHTNTRARTRNILG